MKHSRIIRILDNRSLLMKFVLIFVLCVMVPIIYSGIHYTTITNNWIMGSELENLERENGRIREEISQQFTTALSNANVILADSNISGIISKSYSGEREFYNSFVDGGMKGYFNRYLSLDDSFISMTIFTDNYTITDCDVFEKLGEIQKNTLWYQEMKDSGKRVTVVPDIYNGYHGQVDNKTISVIERERYIGENGSIYGYIKIDMNLAKLARKLDNKNSSMTFYLYNDTYKCYIDPVKKQLFTYDGSETEKADKKVFTVDDKLSSGEYLSGWRVAGVCNLSEIQRQCRHNTISTILVCSAFGLLALLLVYLIYCSNTRRIELLKTGMKDMVNEKFNKITDDPGRDEIAELIHAYNYMTDRMSTLINDVYKLEMKNSSMEAESVKAELKYLQSQINPHFIFNVLSAMQIEALKNNCDELAEQIYGLARLMRRMIDWTDEFRPLSEEFDFIRVYLELEKFRFRDKFTYVINADSRALSHELPIMLVQPLIENSCRHGLQGKKGLREVALSASETDGILIIIVEDNGKGISSADLKKINESFEQKDFEGHVGLKNVRRRLKLYFGDKADMQVNSEENKWTRITIRISVK
ncbi:MAG: sensor histidine kinase [Candidatus Ornithomonoglobus sp.]